VDDPAGTQTPDAGPEPKPPADLITSDAPGDDPQRRTEVVRSEVVTVFDVDTPEHYRVGAVAETKSFAVPGQPGDSAAPFSMGALRAMGGGELLSHARTYFMDDAVAGPFGGADTGTPRGVGKTGIVHSDHAAVFSLAQFDAAFEGDALAKARLQSSPYLEDAGLYWAPSGTSEQDPDRFFLATRSVDVFGNAASVEYDDDAYFAVAATDALGNTVRTDFDPRTLAATRVVDANGVQAHVRFDALGRVTKTWTVGVDGEGTSEDEPATRVEYDLEARPISVTVHTRHEQVMLRKHKRLPEPKTSSHEHTTITYYSGSGGVLQTRTKIEGSRYRAGGQQHIGNKGHGVRTFDPSEGGPGYAVVTGNPVKTVRHDDLGRPVRVEYRDGSVERTAFDAWGQVSFDRNDTAQDEGYEGDLDAREKVDLALHAGTGTSVRYDVLGRAYASFVELRDDTQRQMLSARTHFDAAGNAFETIDAAGRVAEKRRFGLGGLQLSARSVDGGVSASLPNVDGSVLYARRGPVGEGYGTYSRRRRDDGGREAPGVGRRGARGRPRRGRQCLDVSQGAIAAGLRRRRHAGVSRLRPPGGGRASGASLACGPDGPARLDGAGGLPLGGRARRRGGRAARDTATLRVERAVRRKRAARAVAEPTRRADLSRVHRGGAAAAGLSNGA
jgi:YD repeat-containing protein